MANVENPYNTTLQNSLVVTSGIDYTPYITVQFVSEDNNRGVLTGETIQQLPLVDGVAKVTSVPSVSGIGRYRFNDWSDEQGVTYATDDDIKAITFSSDKTFTAHFRYISSSGGGGGTGGGPT